VYVRAAEDLEHADTSDSVNTHLVATDLKRLRSSCREPPVHLANEAYNSVVDLRKHGISETPAAVLTHLMTVVKGLGPRATPTNCGEILAAYLILRER
jgi:hypothetical protein